MLKVEEEMKAESELLRGSSLQGIVVTLKRTRESLGQSGPQNRKGPSHY